MKVNHLPLILIALAAGCAKKADAGHGSPEPSVPSAAPVPVPPAALTAAPPPSLPAKGAQLTRVEKPSEVCMVNDQFMGREQIPTTVSGKTYFGCCAMCKGRLERDSAVRTAKDPVSGNSVDKASAVIGKTASGSVLYFENVSNLEQYAAR